MQTLRHGREGRLSKRICGPCTICCRFFRVPETGKPEDTWCRHCGVGGCGIHHTRPPSCRNFQCFWLMDDSFPDDLRPDLCGVVASFNDDDESAVLHVDPERPDALAMEPGAQWIPALLNVYERVYVVCGDERAMLRKNL